MFDLYIILGILLIIIAFFAFLLVFVANSGYNSTSLSNNDHFEDNDLTITLIKKRNAPGIVKDSDFR